MILGVKLIKKGLEWDWTGKFTNIDGRPAYARQMNLLPCTCPADNQYFFFTVVTPMEYIIERRIRNEFQKGKLFV